MFNNLQALGLGIIGFAIIIGVGTIILWEFQGAVACGADYTFNESATMGGGAECWETANVSHQVSYSDSAVSTNYLTTQLGSTGLAGWTPAIIAISVGMLFLGVFLTRSKGRV